MKIFTKYLIVFLGIISFGVFYTVNTVLSPNIPHLYNSVPISGVSMFPTIKNGDTIIYDELAIPEINDIIAFKCFTKLCQHGDSEEYSGRVKRLIDINEQGCYWVEGDNKEHSLDSRSYGYLCPPDILISGVVLSF